MKQIIRNTVRYYLVLCGLFINGLAIEFLIEKAPSIQEIIVPTPAEFIQTFSYGKYITATAMFALLAISIIVSFLSHCPEAKNHPQCNDPTSERKPKRRYPYHMLKIIRNIISIYLIIYGILMSIVAINFLLIIIAASENIIILTPEMFAQILAYTVHVTSTIMLAILLLSIIAFAITAYNHKLRSQDLPHDQSERGCSTNNDSRHQQK